MENNTVKTNVFQKIAVVLSIAIGAIIILNFTLSFFESDNSIAAAQASLRAESNMVFVEQVYRRVFFVRNTTERRFLGERLDNELLFSVNYKLRAGINLSDLELYERNGVLAVNYNRPQIFSVDVDYGSLELFDGVTRRNIFGQNDPVRMRHFVPIIYGGITGEREGEEIEIERIEDIAVQNGIEQTVRRNAEFWFSSYLSMLGFDNIIFEVRQ